MTRYVTAGAIMAAVLFSSVACGQAASTPRTPAKATQAISTCLGRTGAQVNRKAKRAAWDAQHYLTWGYVTSGNRVVGVIVGSTITKPALRRAVNGCLRPWNGRL